MSFRYEFRNLRASPQLYGLCGFFLLLMGFVFFDALRTYTVLHQTEPLMTRLFQAFWIPSLLILPALSVTVCFQKSSDQHPLKLALSKFFVITVVYLGLWILASYFAEFAHALAPRFPVERCVTPWIRWGGLYVITALSCALIAFDIWICAHVASPMMALLTTSCVHFLILSWHQGMKVYTDMSPWVQLEDSCHGILDLRILTDYGAVTFIFLGLAAIALRRN